MRQEFDSTVDGTEYYGVRSLADLAHVQHQNTYNYGMIEINSIIQSVGLHAHVTVPGLGGYRMQLWIDMDG